MKMVSWALLIVTLLPSYAEQWQPPSTYLGPVINQGAVVKLPDNLNAIQIIEGISIPTQMPKEKAIEPQKCPTDITDIKVIKLWEQLASGKLKRPEDVLKIVNDAMSEVKKDQESNKNHADLKENIKWMDALKHCDASDFFGFSSKDDNGRNMDHFNELTGQNYAVLFIKNNQLWGATLLETQMNTGVLVANISVGMFITNDDITHPMARTSASDISGDLKPYQEIVPMVIQTEQNKAVFYVKFTRLA